jgi:hypothetical protein
VKLAAALALALAASITSAHPGGLDKNGCHHDRATGEYHCHNKSNHPKKSERAAGCVPKRDADGRIKRDYRQRRAFIENHPCPVTGSTNYREPCPGWHVDHVIPLACCGTDDPSNMKWTPAEENLRKGARCPWDQPRAVASP